MYCLISWNEKFLERYSQPLPFSPGVPYWKRIEGHGRIFRIWTFRQDRPLEIHDPKDCHIVHNEPGKSIKQKYVLPAEMHYILHILIQLERKVCIKYLVSC